MAYFLVAYTAYNRDSIFMINRNWLEERVEPLARILAAEKMQLKNDKTGEKLPDELWEQCIPDARKFLGLD
jgi:GTPase SAR1 family protein